VSKITQSRLFRTFQIDFRLIQISTQALMLVPIDVWSSKCTPLCRMQLNILRDGISVWIAPPWTLVARSNVGRAT